MVGPSSPGKNNPPRLIWSMRRRVKWFATLDSWHSDLNDDYHLDMLETVILGCDLQGRARHCDIAGVSG